MLKISNNYNLLFWAFLFQFFFFFLNHCYLIFMCLSPSTHFQFLSLCSVPPACWKDRLRLVCVTLMAYWVLIIYWMRSGHRTIFSTLPWFPWKGKHGMWAEWEPLPSPRVQSTTQNFLFQQCMWPANKQNKQRTVCTSFQEKSFFWQFPLYSLLAANAQTLQAM